MPLYREDILGNVRYLSQRKGHTKGRRIYFRSSCHFAAATWVHVRGKALTVECARCKRPVASFQIASRKDEGKNSRG